MVSDKNVSFDERIKDKFRFAGIITFSLVFQGMISLDDVALELYGPMPFAFANEFVQFAFSFLVDDPNVGDKRMKNKTLGLLLMLVPEKIGKIDDFRDELQKLLLRKFKDIRNIEEVTKKLLMEIIDGYNRIAANLLNIQQAESLSEGIYSTLIEEPQTIVKRRICTVYSKVTFRLIKKFFGSFLNSVPFESTIFTKEGYGEIIASTFELYFFEENRYQEERINDSTTLILVVDIEHRSDEKIIKVLNITKSAPDTKKIALIIKLPEDIEKGSKLYAKFMLNIQQIVSEHPFFSATFQTLSELRHKLMEAFLWALSV